MTRCTDSAATIPVFLLIGAIAATLLSAPLLGRTDLALARFLARLITRAALLALLIRSLAAALLLPVALLLLLLLAAVGLVARLLIAIAVLRTVTLVRHESLLVAR